MWTSLESSGLSNESHETERYLFGNNSIALLACWQEVVEPIWCLITLICPSWQDEDDKCRVLITSPLTGMVLELNSTFSCEFSHPSMFSSFIFNTFDLWINCAASRRSPLIGPNERLMHVYSRMRGVLCWIVLLSASVRHRQHVNNSVLCSVAVSWVMTKRSNLPDTTLWCSARREKVTVCVATG